VSKKEKFELYLSIKKEQLSCSKYVKAMIEEVKKQQELF
jgi:regulatory protein YycH of two-component signal transduction system YycFG